MKKLLQLNILLWILFFTTAAYSQQVTKAFNLKWKGIVEEELPGNVHIKYLYFEGAVVEPGADLPVLSFDFPVDHDRSQVDIELINPVFVPATPEETALLQLNGYDQTSIPLEYQLYLNRKNPNLLVQCTPIRFNPETHTYEKLDSFSLEINVTEAHTGEQESGPRSYAPHSVLASGIWYKLRVSESGIYRITFNDLEAMGINASAIHPDGIRIFGNAGGMLPEKNSNFRYDDLQENSIYVHGASDGIFNPDDYILFYGQSPHIWETQLNFFLRQLHYYDDYNYYYLTVTEEPGNRIGTELPATGPISSEVTEYNDFQVREDELVNLIESGKTWHGDEFGDINSRTYSFNFPNIVPGSDASIKTYVANRTYVNDLMVIGVNGTYADSVTLTSIDVNSTKFGQKKKKTTYYTGLPPTVDVTIDYYPAEAGSRMWLNYIHVNVRSHLKLDNGQLGFRDLGSVAEGAVSQFIIEESGSESRVWDITNPIAPLEMTLEQAGSQSSFVVETDSLREFIAFDGTTYREPEFVGLVPNQDLHGLAPFDMLILTHELFMDQAVQLKELHENHDDLNVLVLTPETIYNEFSSGKQDPTAIRDFLKLFYDQYPGQEPRFLLLFGDGSFDPKDRIEHNTNFIPTFQTAESLITATSYVVDDYFGILDDDEGEDASGYLDVGIGRLPVKTAEEAQQMVDKIQRYLVPEEPQFGKWRTRVCMIADDEDSNLHLEQADSLSSDYFVSPNYNQNKIYLDAFPQIKTPSGHRYPDVTEKIDQQVHDGALIINYIGHGGTGGWAHERVLQQNDMANWSNMNKMPMFVTATCEFSRFDEPEIVSGGELVILNPIGGGIALFTTTRLAYSQSNFRLNQRLYARAFTPVEGEMPYLGDLIREAKPPGQLTTRNFVLLGDPAVRLSYPKHNIETTAVNNVPTDAGSTDTLMSLQKISIEGQVVDLEGNPVDDFTGTLYPVVYDKTTKYKTIGNDPNSFPIDFYNQDKIVWEGKSTVTNGKFEFTFVVPLDIALNIGQAKISYYAFSETEDASGYYNDFYLGSIDPNAPVDNEGPEIDLFINDTLFVSGDLTHENPTLLAFIHDENGINTSQNGIGHNITLVMDDNHSDVLVVNRYFEMTPDDYQSGSLTYDFFDVPNGTHTLTLKAWDSYNNSSTKTIEFVIDRDSELKLSEVKNYPNPFVRETTFTFRHTRPGDELDIALTIFDITGRYVLSYETSITSANREVPFLTWDGRDVNGAQIPNGVYIYTVLVRDELGQENLIQQKLIMGY